MTEQTAAAKIDAAIDPGFYGRLKQISDNINQAIYDGADQVAHAIGALFGAGISAIKNDMAKSPVSDKASSPTIENLAHVKARALDKEIAPPSITPELGKMAQMAVSMPTGHSFADVEHGAGFAPSAVPTALGIQAHGIC